MSSTGAARRRPGKREAIIFQVTTTCPGSPPRCAFHVCPPNLTPSTDARRLLSCHGWTVARSLCSCSAFLRRTAVNAGTALTARIPPADPACLRDLHVQNPMLLPTDCDTAQTVSSLCVYSANCRTILRNKNSSRTLSTVLGT